MLIVVVKGGEPTMKYTKKQQLLNQPTRLSDLTFEDMMEDISSNLDAKIERLQNRRWRKIRNQQL